MKNNSFIRLRDIWEAADNFDGFDEWYIYDTEKGFEWADFSFVDRCFSASDFLDRYGD